ncbi:hypothetical protein [Chitinolyticbacter meiyuanensis]|uniref:hypothetical protein n=1 Tax=Chitinolyticbacter meiyuanensis TaxID=682798 RepID=UPI0011E5AD58|nr:hypothetical protein [Chitinolyticbacter meiyuanensis]
MTEGAYSHPSELFVNQDENWQMLRAQSERETQDKIAVTRKKRELRDQLVQLAAERGYSVEQLIELLDLPDAHAQLG